MNVGIVGLGLIGGSMAKAVKENGGHTVYACDIQESAMLAAKLVNAYDKTLDRQSLPECDIVIISVYPQAAVDYICENAQSFKKGAVVVDCSGVKRFVCDRVLPAAKENGFVFVGGHPMAGTQFWGFGHSRANLFKGAPMILAPQGVSDLALLENLKEFFCSLGFGSVTFTTPEEHDRVIAYTSQLAHVVSNAYIKSPSAQMQKGFSAGSYKDMTRVAKLNEKMWAELFIENSDFLCGEIDVLIENLKQCRTAIKEKDENTLVDLLKTGRENKKQLG